MDWIKFLDTHKISYSDHGANVAKNCVAIRCPWCGDSDPSNHLAIYLDGKGFVCWRNRSHSGSGNKSAKLIQALLGCSWERATKYLGRERLLPSDFMDKIRGTLMKQQDEVLEIEGLSLPSEFKPFRGAPSSRPYVQYLHERGFSELEVARTQGYGIYYASQGEYKGRIIFTVWVDGDLKGWTGRTIYPTETLRYKTLSNNPEKGPPTAPKPIGNYLLFWDKLKAPVPKTIVLCEGPFDAWRVNLLGTKLGVVSTCFFTNTPSREQVGLLHEILPKFDNRIILLDQETSSQVARIKSQLVAFDLTVRQLPPQYKDPAELPNTEVLKEVLAI